ncbi:hypothetical protein V1478_009661 [Vespula squamosa]|uniref:Uncharacterized protein n=1 Tax=Vespula squamosa TaxID=30214 RepID=A0ABD2AQA7_VESSQ
MNGSFFAADFPAGGFCGFLAKEMKGKTRDSGIKLETKRVVLNFEAYASGISDEIAVKNCTVLPKPSLLPRRLYGPNKSRGEFLDDTIKSGNSGFSDSENYPIFFTSGIVGKGGTDERRIVGKRGMPRVKG